MLGVEPVTLIKYPTPAAVLQGIVHVIVPAAVPAKVPIVTGAAKLPAALESCAVKVFPAVNAPVIVKGTLTVAQAQNGLPAIVPVVIVCPEKVFGKKERKLEIEEIKNATKINFAAF